MNGSVARHEFRLGRDLPVPIPEILLSLHRFFPLDFSGTAPAPPQCGGPGSWINPSHWHYSEGSR
jgi:hypothetical protein